MNLYLILEDDSEILLPSTLMVENLVNEANYSLERAPFSKLSVLAGDGLPVAQAMIVRGTTYHASSGAADFWLQNFIDHVDQAVAFKMNDEVIPIHSADLVALPVGLPRVLSVTLRLFPETAI